jgi:hypothetical protein
LDNADLLGPLAAFGLIRFLGVIGGILFLGIIPVICFWKILAKAAFCSPRWALLAFMPGSQVILLIVLAAAEW